MIIISPIALVVKSDTAFNLKSALFAVAWIAMTHPPPGPLLYADGGAAGGSGSRHRGVRYSASGGNSARNPPSRAVVKYPSLTASRLNPMSSLALSSWLYATSHQLVALPVGARAPQ